MQAYLRTHPLVDLVFSLVCFVGAGAVFWWISRIGPGIDEKIADKRGRLFFRGARLIAWLMPLGLLLATVGVALRIGILPAHIVVALLAVAQMLLMIAKKYAVAFRMAGVELFLAIPYVSIGLFGMPDTGIMGLVGGIWDPYFALWLAIAFSLVVAAWGCFKAASQLSERRQELKP